MFPLNPEETRMGCDLIQLKTNCQIDSMRIESIWISMIANEKSYAPLLVKISRFPI